ncbi:unnamed protein product, partial [Protopolystoma xenopodis]
MKSDEEVTDDELSSGLLAHTNERTFDPHGNLIQTTGWCNDKDFSVLKDLKRSSFPDGNTKASNKLHETHQLEKSVSSNTCDKESNEELINVIGRREHEHQVSCEPLQQPVIGRLNDENPHLNVTHQQSQQSALFSPPHAQYTNSNLRCAEGVWPQLSSKGHSRRISSQRQIYLLGPSPKHLYYPIRLASDIGSNEESINTEAEICHALEAGLVDGSVGSLDNESKWEEYK